VKHSTRQQQQTLQTMANQAIFDDAMTQLFADDKNAAVEAMFAWMQRETKAPKVVVESAKSSMQTLHLLTFNEKKKLFQAFVRKETHASGPLYGVQSLPAKWDEAKEQDAFSCQWGTSQQKDINIEKVRYLDGVAGTVRDQIKRAQNPMDCISVPTKRARKEE